MISSGCSLAIAARTTCSTSLGSRTLRVSTLSNPNSVVIVRLVRIAHWGGRSSNPSLRGQASIARRTGYPAFAGYDDGKMGELHLKPRQIRKRELAAVHVHAAEFGAAVQRRKHFSGVEQPLRVEGAFQPLLLVEIDFGKHLRHQVALLDADAVLAGQHAAEFDAGAQDIGAERLRPLHLAGLVGVVEDQRMQIAVA